MGKEPIIIVGGEPNSVFLEIFFKSLKTNIYKSPLIIIISKKLLQEQMKKLDFYFKINDIDKELKDFSKLTNKKINLINVDYKFKKCFEKITSKSNKYIDETFKIALNFMKQNNLSKFINGPVSKKSFLIYSSQISGFRVGSINFKEVLSTFSNSNQVLICSALYIIFIMRWMIKKTEQLQ